MPRGTHDWLTQLDAAQVRVGELLQFTPIGLGKRKREHVQPTEIRREWMALKDVADASADAGFAVVADEVRRLAQRSAEAARETGRLIEASRGTAHQGSEHVSQVVQSITGFTRSWTG